MGTPHMVEQVIKYSDGTETVIKYRGVIENGVLTPDNMDEEIKPAEVAPEVAPDVAEEVIETPASVDEVVSN